MRVREMATHLWDSHRGSLVLLAVLLLLNFCLYVGFGHFMTPRILDKEKRFVQRQTEVRQILHNQAGASKSPEQLYVLGSQDLSKFKESVPDYQDFTALIEELLVLSNDADLEINQVSYKSETIAESSLLKFNLSFNVTGKYYQIKRFIYSLEQSIRLVAIKQIGLQGGGDDTVSLRLAVETYFMHEGRDS